MQRVSDRIAATFAAAIGETADADQVSWEVFPVPVPGPQGQPMMGWGFVLIRPALAIGEHHLVMNVATAPMPEDEAIRSIVPQMVEVLRQQHAQAVQAALSPQNGQPAMPQGPTMPLFPPGTPGGRGPAPAN